jgi:hypothetical protein
VLRAGVLCLLAGLQPRGAVGPRSRQSSVAATSFFLVVDCKTWGRWYHYTVPSHAWRFLLRPRKRRPRGQHGVSDKSLTRWSIRRKPEVTMEGERPCKFVITIFCAGIRKYDLPQFRCRYRRSVFTDLLAGPRTSGNSHLRIPHRGSVNTFSRQYRRSRGKCLHLQFAVLVGAFTCSC